MAIVFDDTVGGADSNSYSSVADYNQYRENNGLSVLADEAAQVTLIKATSFIDNQYRTKWCTNNATNANQALHWPQTGAKDYAGNELAANEIPAQVKQSVYEYAIRAEGQNTLDPANATNTKSEELEGVGKLEYFSKNTAGSLPDDFKFIDSILSGLICSASGGITFIDARRY